MEGDYYYYYGPVHPGYEGQGTLTPLPAICGFAQVAATTPEANTQVEAISVLNLSVSPPQETPLYTLKYKTPQKTPNTSAPDS